MTKITNLRELLIDELQDLHSAETQLVKAIPKMAESASDAGLKEAFAHHLEQTKEHVVRLERVLAILEAKPKGRTCDAMKGLVSEGRQAISDDADGAVRDAALICAAQKVEHYEMAGYGTVRTFARLVGEEEVAVVLQQTLDEEGAANQKLMGLAEALNPEALHAAGAPARD